MNVWDPNGNWVNLQGSTQIIGGNDENIYSDMQIFVFNTSAIEFLFRRPFMFPRGTELTFDEGQHQIILKESASGLSDTLLFWVVCLQDTRDFLILDYDSTATYCVETDDLIACLDTVYSFCDSSGSSVYSVSIRDGDSCLQVNAERAGPGQLCLVACDSLGICDTTYLIIRVGNGVGSQLIEEIVDLGTQQTFCWDESIFARPIARIENRCPDRADDIIEYTIDQSTNCV